MIFFYLSNYDYLTHFGSLKILKLFKTWISTSRALRVRLSIRTVYILFEKTTNITKLCQPPSFVSFFFDSFRQTQLFLKKILFNVHVQDKTYKISFWSVKKKRYKFLFHITETCFVVFFFLRYISYATWIYVIMILIGRLLQVM